VSLVRFSELWGAAQFPPERVAQVDLEWAEQQLGVQFPADYKRAVMQTGLPRTTIALLDAIVERGLDLHGVGDFYSPGEIVEETIESREVGMPQHLIAFANDGCGNLFCFDAEQLRRPIGGGHGVWFFDHEFERVDQIAPSFTDWTDMLCKVKPWP
jgi:hypothetical protein